MHSLSPQTLFYVTVCSTAWWRDQRAPGAFHLGQWEAFSFFATRASGPSPTPSKIPKNLGSRSGLHPVRPLSGHRSIGGEIRGPGTKAGRRRRMPRSLAGDGLGRVPARPWKHRCFLPGRGTAPRPAGRRLCVRVSEEGITQRERLGQAGRGVGQRPGARPPLLTFRSVAQEKIYS